MASLKEIKRRIKSVKNTEKITYAMKLVSAAKLRKVQDALLQTRDYMTALEDLLAHVMQERAQEAAQHRIMMPRKTVHTVRLIVIGGKRGLCGAYNSNVNHLLDRALAQYDENVKCEILPIGTKPADYCKRRNYEFIPDYVDLSDNVEDWPLHDIYDAQEKAFLSKEVDEVLLLYTKFQSAMSVHPTIEKFLPFSVELQEQTTTPTTGLVYKPSIEEVFSILIPKYARAKLLQTCLESKTSEQGSRMTAMDAATHNAGELISALTITHNKLRQASITNDILDIIGGSSATK